MIETRKLSAILAADVAGFSRLAGADEDRTLARLRALRSDLIDPTIAVHHGRVVKRTGDGALVEFRSVVDAVRCAVEIQEAMVERNAGVPADRRIEFRIGIHLGDVVEESDGDLMGNGINIAARLESICEPGAICLSEDACRQVRGRLDLAVADLGPTQLNNIAEPIRVFSLQVRAPAATKSAPVPAPEISAPPRLSIVVLPFANIGGGPEQEHFADGVTESLTTDVSRIRGSFVIGRNTAFTYKGKHVDLKEIGRDLNVRYVLEGSVQRGGNRMRVNVQLIDAEAGNHLWAERFDKPLTDLFDMQDEIVARLASALNAHLITAEARRAEQTPTPNSVDLYFQGLAWLNKGPTPVNVAQARCFFERALNDDPNNVDALIASARVIALEGLMSLVADPTAAFAAAEAKLTKALSLVPDHTHGHMVLGLVDIWTRRAAEGIAECEHALEQDRNLAEAHSLIGYGKIFVGDVLIEGDDILGEGVNIAARLEGICEPGGVLISGTAYDHVRGKIDADFVDLGDKDLKNIALPVRGYAISATSEIKTPALSAEAPSTSEPPHLSIVVLPFANMSRDPEQEYFVDGVTESLTTDLSRIYGAFVIAHNTAFTYKGNRIDVKQIGRELNVRYVLEGSVQRAGARMRVNVQLIDAEKGQHLWAERFDKPLADLFDMQDEIVAHLANALGAQLVAAEARRAERAPNPNSMDLCFQGWARWNRGVAPDNLAEARRIFDRALALDASNVWGLVGSAWVDSALALSFLADDRAARFAAAEAAAIKALTLAPENALAHLALGAVQTFTDRAAQGVRQCERALALDRNLAGAHATIGNGKIQLGQAEETEEHIREALRLSPRDPNAYMWCFIVGSAKVRLGREEEAVAWLRRSVEANRSFPGSHFVLAAALARLGRLAEARSEARTGLALNPTFTIARFPAGASSDDGPADLAGYERIIDGLRKAGVPEA